jgi:hypothetical protein
MAGLDLPPHVTVDVTPEVIGSDLWPVLIDSLDIATPPSLNGEVMIATATAEAVRDALREWASRKRDKALESLDSLRGQFKDFLAAAKAPPTPCACFLPPIVRNEVGPETATYKGVQRVLPETSWDFQRWNGLREHLTTEEQAEVDMICAEIDRLTAESHEEIRALNAALLEAALPALRQAKAEADAEALHRRVAAAEADANARARVREARLASGYWKLNVGAYNPRRYSAPWCARVTGTKARGELVYEFCDSTARHGSSGMLRAPCKPGEIVAWGQKDMRNPSRSDHVLLVMGDDGGMTEIDRTEAFKMLSAA